MTLRKPNMVSLEYSLQTDSTLSGGPPVTAQDPPMDVTLPLLSHTYPHHFSHELLSVPPQNLQGVLHAPSSSASLSSSHTFSPKQAGLGQERTGIRWDL